jgi:hypothetical protein
MSDLQLFVLSSLTGIVLAVLWIAWDLRSRR